jgi:selenocysteine lyase/cysteine desulfurase
VNQSRAIQLRKIEVPAVLAGSFLKLVRIAELSSLPANLGARQPLSRPASTAAFTLEGYTPRQTAERLGQEGIFVWDLRYYALAVTERLGIEEGGGMVRLGIAHYNTAAGPPRLLCCNR